MPILTTIINEVGCVKGSEWPSCYVQVAKCAMRHGGLRPMMSHLQHSEQFNRPPLVGPCLHTIRNQDLIVPFEGLRMGWRDASFLMQEAVSGEAASSPFTG